MFTLTIQFADIAELQSFIATNRHDAPKEVVAQIQHGAEQAIVEAPPTPAVAAPKPRGRPKKSETPAAAEASASKDQGEPSSAPVSQTTTATLDDARAALQTLVTTKGMDNAFDVLKQFNAQRVSEVKAEDFAPFVAACKAA